MSLVMEMECRCDKCPATTRARYPLPDANFGQPHPAWEACDGHSIDGWRLPHGEKSPGPAVFCPIHAEAKP